MNHISDDEWKELMTRVNGENSFIDFGDYAEDFSCFITGRQTLLYGYLNDRHSRRLGVVRCVGIAGPAPDGRATTSFIWEREDNKDALNQQRWIPVELPATVVDALIKELLYLKKLVHKKYKIIE